MFYSWSCGSCRCTASCCSWPFSLPWLLPPFLCRLCALPSQDGAGYIFDARHWLSACDELYNVRKRSRVRSRGFARVYRGRHDAARGVIACCRLGERARAVGRRRRRWSAARLAIRLVPVKVDVDVELSARRELECTASVACPGRTSRSRSIALAVPVRRPAPGCCCCRELHSGPTGTRRRHPSCIAREPRRHRLAHRQLQRRSWRKVKAAAHRRGVKANLGTPKARSELPSDDPPTCTSLRAGCQVFSQPTRGSLPTLLSYTYTYTSIYIYTSSPPPCTPLPALLSLSPSHASASSSSFSSFLVTVLIPLRCSHVRVHWVSAVSCIRLELPLTCSTQISHIPHLQERHSVSAQLLSSHWTRGLTGQICRHSRRD
jgi:hypothetical protein